MTSPVSYDHEQETRIGRGAISQMVRDLEANEERNNYRWEPFTAAFIEEIRRARVFVDCGAEFGFYIRLALKYGPPDIRVIAFEPDPARYDLLVETFADVPQVELHREAVADGTTSRVATKVRSGATLTIVPQPGNAGQSPLMGVDVQTVALDDVLGDVDVDVVKMDVEGAELLAWMGMSRLLQRRRTSVYVHVHARFSGPNLAALGRMCEEAGYEMCDGEGRRPASSAWRVIRSRGVLAPPWPARVVTSDVSASVSSILKDLAAGIHETTPATEHVVRRRYKSVIDDVLLRADLTPEETLRIAALRPRLGYSWALPVPTNH